MSIEYLVIQAGEAIKRLAVTFERKEGEGHRSGITDGDKLAHRTMLSIFESTSDAVLLSEESTQTAREYAQSDVRNILTAQNAVIFDPLDGTTSKGNELGTWCVGAAEMRSGEFTASAIYAPSLNGGMLVTAESGRGVIRSEWMAESFWRGRRFESVSIYKVPSQSTPIESSVIAMGVDTTLYPSFMAMVPGISRRIRAWTLANSGLLALAQVACGRLQAVIQTPQKAWDWAPAYRAVIEGGKNFRFFRLIQNGAAADLVDVPSYDADAFRANPKHNRLGFVAGESDVVDFLYSRLPRTGWSRDDPDTVST